MAIPRSEQETTLVYEAESNMWTVYSCVPKHIRRIQSITDNVTVVEEENGSPLAIKAKLTAKQVRMVNERVLSEEQKEALADRMRSIAEKRNEESQKIETTLAGG